VLLPAV